MYTMLNIFFCCIASSLFAQHYKVGVIGAGHVGLPLAAALLTHGHTIVCYDAEVTTISSLTNKMVPIYEPRLTEILFDDLYKHKISFSAHTSLGIHDIYYICVPTPNDCNGDCDYSAIQNSLQHIVAACVNTPCIACVKSTVAPGTMKKLKHYLKNISGDHVQLIYNPEFMREGSAVQDMYTNPVILGGEDKDAQDLIAGLFNFLPENVCVIKTDFETAEMIKYAWNCFSAMRITFVNELAYVSRLVGANIKDVIGAVACSEQLLPTRVIKPGPGFGGSCFPKDIAACIKLLNDLGIDSSLIKQTMASNDAHKQRVIHTILDCLAPCHIKNSTYNPLVALLGLSFKANTNDIRNAPAIDIIKALRAHDVAIKVYDPQAMNNMKKLFPDIAYANCAYEAVKDVDCIVVLTEWDEIKKIDLTKVAALCGKRVLIDTRNLYDPAELRALGFISINMGLKNG